MVIIADLILISESLVALLLDLPLYIFAITLMFVMMSLLQMHSSTWYDNKWWHSLEQDVCLADQDLDYVIGNKETNPVEEFIEEHIHGMLTKAKEQLTGRIMFTRSINYLYHRRMKS